MPDETFLRQGLIIGHLEKLLGPYQASLFNMEKCHTIMTVNVLSAMGGSVDITLINSLGCNIKQNRKST